MDQLWIDLDQLSTWINFSTWMNFSTRIDFTLDRQIREELENRQILATKDDDDHSVKKIEKIGRNDFFSFVKT